MEVSQLSLARMLLSCFLGGVLMGLLYEVLLLPRLLLFGVLSPSVQRLKERLLLPRALCPLMQAGATKATQRIRPGKGKRIGSAVLLGMADTLFCLIGAILLLLLLYATNHGEFRISALLALLFGVLLCRMTLLRLLSLVIQCAYVLVRGVAVWTVALLSYPFLHLALFLWRRTATPRQRIKEKYLNYKQKRVLRAARRNRKKEYSDITSSNIENVEPPHGRAAPDGRRVFCAGVSHTGRQ